MGRIIGLIGCTCLVIVAMRLTNLQYTDHTLKGGEASARAKLSPRDHYRQGKDAFLRGRYPDAIRHLETVAVSSAGLTGIERRQADDYLTRARTRLQGATAGAVVRAQSDPFAIEEEAEEPVAEEQSSPLSDATRVRVDRLMTMAQAALQRGDRSEALKLSQQANLLSRDAKLAFAKGELTPGQFLAKLQGPTAGSSPAAAPAWVDEELPAKPAAKQKVQQVAGQSGPDGFEDGIVQAGVQSGGKSAASSSPQQSGKGQATALITQARADLKAGNYDEARRKALQADELDQTYDLFEDRPELLLADVDRLSSTLTIARQNPPAAKGAAQAVAKETNGSASNKSPVSQASATAKQGTANKQATANDGPKQQALKLLELARQDMVNGNLDGAQAKAEQAGQLNVAYKLFEDMPELVLNEVAARRASEGLAQNDPAAAPAKGTNSTAKPQAKALLAKARKAMTEGRIDEARQLAIEADRLKAPYDLFDDRPDIVLTDIARAAKRGPGSPTSASGAANDRVSVASATEDLPAETSVETPVETPVETNVAANKPAAARPNLSPAQTEAIEKLRQARQLMTSGRFDESRALAEEVEAMGVTYPVFADRPDLVLADLNKKTNSGNVASRKPGRNTSVTTADVSNELPSDPTENPFAPKTRSARNVTAASGTGRRPSNTLSADNITEIDPTGQSATELYNRGMAELNRNNRAAAYSSFLAAHQSGQKLDNVRAQRLNDYLRELAPKSARNGIQLANNQVEEPSLNDPLMDDAQAPTPLDAAQQEQMVKTDRLRSEVLNSVFKAERMKDTDPEAALTLIDQTLAKVESAELSEQATATLTRQLNKTRSTLQSEVVRQQPNLDLKKRNQEVKDALEGNVIKSIRVEQEYAKLVEEFNELYKEQRFAEAEIIAKKAKEMNPKDETAVMMEWKSKIARRAASNDKLRNDKEESFWGQLNDVELATVVNVGDANPLKHGDNWKALTERRKGKYRTDNRTRNEEDLRIEESLQKRISLHEDQVPLSDVVAKIKAVADINIVLDTAGLEEEGVNSNTPVTIDVEGIKVKSVLNLVLSRFNLAYHIDNEVLKITSRIRQQGELVVATYSVADLVIPIANFGPQNNNLFGGGPANGGLSNTGGAQMSVPPGGYPGMGQVGPNATNPLVGESADGRPSSRPQAPDFNSLTDLLVSTIAPDSWDSVGGQASVRHYETTLSLVIRQTQKVHEEIADLLDQLRRLQDLQVTIEVRFVTVTDRFFERIGIDFDFGLQSSLPGPDVDNSGLPIQPFGSIIQPQSGIQGTQQQQGQQGQQGQQNQQGTAGTGFFTQGPRRQLSNRSNYPTGTILGLSAPGQFTETTDIPFQQGSFEVGVPTFGGFNPKAGVEMGLAILSDVEAFFFIQAAQGDQRSNLLFAPKVTLFNGQLGHVDSTVRRPFVISLIPTVGFFSTGFQPVIAVIPEGISLDVTAVVSADRRFVRLTVAPLFSNITDVFTFSFVGGSTGGAQQGQQGQGQGGGQGQNGGQFGIGGGVGTMSIMNALFTQQQNGQQGQQGQQQQQGAGANLTVTVQQPVVEQVTVNTTVSVPDGGTVLLGGVKRLREGRNMSGVPILNKIPYVSRLFKNTGVGRETESLMLMVTPRIIIQEEEEELLGIPRAN